MSHRCSSVNVRFHPGPGPGASPARRHTARAAWHRVHRSQRPIPLCGRHAADSGAGTIPARVDDRLSSAPTGLGNPWNFFLFCCPRPSPGTRVPSTMHYLAVIPNPAQSAPAENVELDEFATLRTICATRACRGFPPKLRPRPRSRERCPSDRAMRACRHLPTSRASLDLAGSLPTLARIERPARHRPTACGSQRSETGWMPAARSSFSKLARFCR